ncbi:hypothetical protein [Nocardia sp. JCM 34519]|uniref:hypothetical protein n=1 Tax=Nocardia sp. JCM 34519 TaxID=2876118 RepID=UPI001CE44238|nr:hypothetical protein [Nocardia sp. JCM 34519]
MQEAAGEQDSAAVQDVAGEQKPVAEHASAEIAGAAIGSVTDGSAAELPDAEPHAIVAAQTPIQSETAESAVAAASPVEDAMAPVGVADGSEGAESSADAAEAEPTDAVVDTPTDAVSAPERAAGADSVIENGSAEAHSTVDAGSSATGEASAAVSDAPGSGESPRAATSFATDDQAGTDSGLGDVAESNSGNSRAGDHESTTVSPAAVDIPPKGDATSATWSEYGSSPLS